MEGAKTPAGSAGQVRPRRRFRGEEAHRPPRGKRSSLEWKSTAPSTSKRKRLRTTTSIFIEFVYSLSRLVNQAGFSPNVHGLYIKELNNLSIVPSRI
ncbi:Ribose 5-phosphate isomerase B [Bacillus badius]|uniref:Ribose 5-phosphate isomerase B n=1 Tax=Bacillus badius TaxID=1455 RepID=A0ABR5AZZ2_BACBA|nr:Ribose 5-phosphate isomerase B [Bacillus badius]